MTGDDIRKIFLGHTLFRLDTVLGTRLVPIFYVVGLAALLLWAVIHLFESFGRNFGDGLWGLLEIVVFGGFGIVVLRLVCEYLLVFFKAHESAARTVGLTLGSSSLMDDVKDAIHDIAAEEGDDEGRYPSPAIVDEILPPATLDDVTPPTARASGRRTARRTPPITPPSTPDV